MPTELIRVDLDLIYPPFRDKLIGALAACKARGVNYYWTSGTRFWAEQHQLRMKFLAGTGGRAAPAGYSAHQFGLAGDLTFDAQPQAPGLPPRWGEKDYDVLGEELARAGLRWGAAYGDKPHANWPNFENGDQLAPLRALWSSTEGDNAAKLQACWAYVSAAPV